MEKRTDRRTCGIVTAAQVLWLLLLVVPGNAQIPHLTPAAGKAAAASDAAAGSAAKAEKPSQPEAIPLPEIAVGSVQLNLTLRNLTASLPDKEQRAAMEAATQAWEADLPAKRKQVDEMLRTRPTSTELRELKNYWESERADTDVRKKQASNWAEEAQKATKRLDELGQRWSATRTAYETEPALRPVLDLVRESLRSIGEQQTAARDALLGAVRLQVTTTQQDQAAAQVVEQLSAEQAATGVLFRRDSLPLWDRQSLREHADGQGVFGWSSVRWNAAVGFGSEYKRALTLLAGLLLVSLWVTYQISRRVAGVVPRGEAQACVLLILNRWVALGMAVPLLFACLLVPRAPTALIGSIILVWCFPILRLLPAQVPRAKATVSRAVGIYAAYALMVLLMPSPVYSRDANFVMSCLAVLIFGNLVRPSRIRAEWAANRRLVCEVLVVLAAVGISAAANLLGYMRLSQYIRVSFIFGAFLAMGIYSTVRTCALLLTEAVDTDAGSRLALVRHHRQATLKWLPRLLHGLGFTALAGCGTRPAGNSRRPHRERRARSGAPDGPSFESHTRHAPQCDIDSGGRVSDRPDSSLPVAGGDPLPPQSAARNTRVDRVERLLCAGAGVHRVGCERRFDRVEQADVIHGRHRRGCRLRSAEHPQQLHFRAHPPVRASD